MGAGFVTAAPIVFANHGLRHSGDIERYLLTLVGGLHARGLRPTVVARRFDAALPEYGWVDALRVPTWGLSGVLRDLWFDRGLRALKRRRGWRAVIALSQTAAADIAICGSTHPGYLEAMSKRADWRDHLAIALERRHLQGAAVVIAHSRLMAAQVQRFHGAPAERIEVLYPPVDARRFHPVIPETRHRLRAVLGLPRDRAVFLLASTGHARKGLDLLVRTLGHSPLPVLLAVAGRPPCVEAPNLRYLGYRSDIENVYRAVDCTVMASRFEPFGLVGVESALCGTPVIGAEGMGVMEVLRGDARLPFSLDVRGSLEAAVALALTRWRAGRLALTEPAPRARLRPVGRSTPRCAAELGEPAERRAVRVPPQPPGCRLAGRMRLRHGYHPAVTHDSSPAAQPFAPMLPIAHNQRRTVSEAIAGALAPTYTPLEIAISDDSSSDAAREAMQHTAAGYSGPHRVLLNRDPANLGIGAHLSRLVELSQGELLFVTVGDDVSLPERVARTVAAWEAAGRRADLIASPLIDIDAEAGCTANDGRAIFLATPARPTGWPGRPAWSARSKPGRDICSSASGRCPPARWPKT